LQLISGQGLTGLTGRSNINGGHGPVFPTLIAFLILVLGRNTEHLAWAVRLIALVNPLLAYFLVKRISSPVAGLIAAALVALFGYYVKSSFSLDAVLLTFYLLALLVLLAAIKRNSSLLALLSGLLLGVSILTKETAFANLPLALLAVLLLDWDLRKALWHYLGVVLVCLPWWIWAWSATGEVYLVDRLPVSLQVPIVMATAVLLGLAAGAYVSGMVARFLADERRRRWTGWFVVLAWTVSLSGLLLATAAAALAKLSFEHLRLYLAHLLAPSIVVVPTLLVVGLAGLHALQKGRVGLIGLLGFYVTIVGILAQLLGLVDLGFLVMVGALVILVGLALYGIGTVRARVLPLWCGMLLIATLAIAIPLGPYTNVWFGFVWLALGYILWLRRGMATEPPSRVS
jgi:4-amino-4-deoxy-L-arabinose transferase-like glycosyltransferase